MIRAVTTARSGRRSSVPHSINIQFHAAGPEMIGLAAGWAREFSLYAAIGRLFEGTAVTAEKGDPAPALEFIPNPDYLLLKVHPIQVPAGASLYDLVRINEGCLVLQLGRHRPEGVPESSLHAASADAATMKLWRRLIARARRHMNRGAVMVSPNRNSCERAPGHLYTDEALNLQRTGVTMLAIAGSVTFRLTPDSQTRPLPDPDLTALSAVTSIVEMAVTNELLPAELVAEFVTRLRRRELLTDDATAGDLVTLLLTLQQRLVYAFGGEQEYPDARSPATVYSLHLPDRRQADAVQSALAGRNITDVIVKVRKPDRHGDPSPDTALPWEILLTCPVMAPDPAHKQHEAECIELAHAHGGAYAGWRR